MNGKISVKVCGITRQKDIEQSLSLGADYLGFIVYPNSPMALSLKKAEELSASVPRGKRVIVDVKIKPTDLERYQRAGFDYFQIHIDPDINQTILQSYLDRVGREHLWLAPRLAPGDPFPEWLLNYTRTILFDTYSKDQIGGTGQTGDFARFAELKVRFSDTNWVLAGGLNPTNIIEAACTSTALAVDVNSGVETEPGVKDSEKLYAFFQALRNGFQ